MKPIPCSCLFVASLLLLCAACTSPIPPSDYRITQTEESLQLSVKEQPVLNFNIATVKAPDSLPSYYDRSGHVHPLYTPSGTILTDGFPKGHTHQHGLFMTWVNTTFRGEKVDFWNQHNETGTVKALGVRDTFVNQESAGATVELMHVSTQHGPVLKEERSFVVSAQEEVFILDVLSDQYALTSDTLFLNEYHYGGFAFRGSKYWNEVDPIANDSMQILTSEGLTRDETNHTRPHWIAAYGKVEGKMASIVIMGHPDNFHFPQPVRVHPSMPYFVFSPTVLGAFYIVQGKMYRSAYRILTFDEKPDPQKIETFWEDYRESKPRDFKAVQ